MFLDIQMFSHDFINFLILDTYYLDLFLVDIG